MSKFLTTEGLSKLLTNVKTVFATKTEVTTVVNDLKSPSNEIGQSFVHTSGNETIAGTKTFSSTISGSIDGNAATATKIYRAADSVSHVQGCQVGNALVSSTHTGYGAIWNAATKNTRVSMATYPSNNDVVYLISCTNADVASSTNTIHKSLTWDANNGTLTANNFSGPLTGNVTGNCSGSSGSCTGNAATATKATGDSAGNNINTTYIKALSVSGKTITYTKGNGTTGTITTQDTVYTHPTTAGNKHIPSGGSSGQFLKWSANGTATWAADNNTTYANFTKATSSAAGKAGLVPAPAKGYQTRFLRGDATWQTVSTSSDRRVKQQFADIPDAVLDAWENVHWMQFKMNDEVEEKGSSAAIHTGLVVQDIQDIFTAKGLNANLYDMVSHEEWEATEEEKDEDGNVAVEASPAYEQWYLRYEQALAIEAAYQRRRADRLEARIAALEAKMKD